MDPKELAAKFAAENPAAAALIRAEGAQAEIARAASVREQLMPGHEALINTLAADGKTSGPEAAMAVLSAERIANKGRASDILEDRLDPVGAAASATAAR